MSPFRRPARAAVLILSTTAVLTGVGAGVSMAAPSSSNSNHTSSSSRSQSAWGGQSSSRSQSASGGESSGRSQSASGGQSSGRWQSASGGQSSGRSQSASGGQRLAYNQTQVTYTNAKGTEIVKNTFTRADGTKHVIERDSKSDKVTADYEVAARKEQTAQRSSGNAGSTANRSSANGGSTAQRSSGNGGSTAQRSSGNGGSTADRSSSNGGSTANRSSSNSGSTNSSATSGAAANQTTSRDASATAARPALKALPPKDQSQALSSGTLVTKDGYKLQVKTFRPQESSGEKGLVVQTYDPQTGRTVQKWPSGSLRVVDWGKRLPYKEKQDAGSHQVTVSAYAGGGATFQVAWDANGNVSLAPSVGLGGGSEASYKYSSKPVSTANTPFVQAKGDIKLANGAASVGAEAKVTQTSAEASAKGSVGAKTVSAGKKASIPEPGAFDAVKTETYTEAQVKQKFGSGAVAAVSAGAQVYIEGKTIRQMLGTDYDQTQYYKTDSTGLWPADFNDFKQVPASQTPGGKK